LVSEHDDPTGEHELYEEVPPRSIFAATWFRVVLVVIIIGVIGAVAIPYVLDWMNPPPSRPAVATKSPVVPSTPGASSAPETSAAPDKKDSTLIPAPVAPTVPPPAAQGKPTTLPARPAEPKPSVAKPEPKTAAAPADAKSKSAMAVTETTPHTPKPQPAKPETTATPPPAATPPPTAKPETTPKADTLAKAETPARADAPKPATAASIKDDAKLAVAAKSTPAPKRAAVTATPPAPAKAGGPFWVQVGAFKDAETARRLAAKLRADNFQVEESVTRGGGSTVTSAPRPPVVTKAPSTDIGADQYDVLVTGQTPEELNKRLAAKGLAAEASGAGMVVKPSLPLRDAVALSKDLAVEGFKVQVRRTGGPSASTSSAPPPSPPAASEGGSALHRVRVGAFADRAAAQAAARQLETKGYKPYIARGDQ